MLALPTAALNSCVGASRTAPIAWDKTFPVRCWRYLIRRRVKVTIILATVLLAEDVLLGECPHAVFDLADSWTVVGLLLIVLGLFLRSWAAGVLHKNSFLATGGPYCLTRNPLYLGSLLMMVGFFVVVGDWDNIIITVALFFMIYIPKIREEEAYLVQKFGTAWTDYVARVPQLFPHRIVTTQLFDDWRLGRWLANREYNAVVGTYLGLMSMQTWHDVSSWLS